VGIARSLAPVILSLLLAGLGGCAGVKFAGAPPAALPLAPESLITPGLTPVGGDAWAKNVDYVLLGEEHPNPCDHLAQATAIRRLVAAGLRPVIGLEMVPADRQDILDAFNRGGLALDDLARALDWRRTWGFDFALYAPIFQMAREYRLPVFALNAPTGLAREVGHKGLDALPPIKRAALPGAIVPPAPAQVAELRELFNEHQTMRQKAGHPASAGSGRDPFADFLTVQSLWDTQMASRARYARALYGRPVAVVAGGGHVEQGFGIARRLALLDPGTRVLAVMPWRGGEAPDPAAADLFYFCPASQRSRLGLLLAQEIAAPGHQAPPPLVTEVVPDSPAAKAGLLPGDALTAAGDRPVTALTELHTAAVTAAMAGKPLTLTVSRGGEPVTITIPLPKAPK
jgi:uncharacterized iron-regulated protein